MPDNDEPLPQTIIENCRFEDNAEGVIWIDTPPGERHMFRIENCRFENPPEGGIECLTSQTR